nr:flagellar hook-length control protein FliK [uncultured Dethiosulfovibrio sp.]
MLIGADRLFALPNADETERIVPSSPKAKGEGHGRFESLLYNTSAQQAEVPEEAQKTRPEEGSETVASLLSELLSTASKDGRLKLPSFATPLKNGDGTMVASKVEGTAEGDSDASLADGNAEIAEINVEDISSSQIDDLLSSLLGPVIHKAVVTEQQLPGQAEIETVVKAESTASDPTIKPETAGSVPEVQKDQHSIPTTGIKDEVVVSELSGRNDQPSKPSPLNPLDQPSVSGITSEPDPIEPEGAETVSRGKPDQVPAYSGEVSSSAKPEATQPAPATAELQPQVPGQAEMETIETVVKAESTASESTIKPETAGSGPEVQKDQPSIPTTGIKDEVVVSKPSGRNDQPSKPSPLNPLDQSSVLGITAEPDPIELEGAETVSRGKPDQVPAYSGEVLSSAKPEATQPSPIMAELQPQVPGQTEIETVVKAESTASESTIKPETAGSGPEVQKDQPSIPTTGIKDEFVVSEPSARNDQPSKPSPLNPLDQSSVLGITAEPDPIELEGAETVSRGKPDQVPAYSGEVLSSAKPEATQPSPIMAELQPQVPGQTEIETVVKAESTASEPTIKPETAGSGPEVQKDQPSTPTTGIKDEVVVSEPSGRNDQPSKPSPLNPLDQPSILGITAEPDPIELEGAETVSRGKPDQVPAYSGEVSSSAKPEATQPAPATAELHQSQVPEQAEIETVVKAESTASEPTIKPETAGSGPEVQKDQLSIPTTGIKDEVVVSEPSGRNDQPSKPSPLNPLDQPSVSGITAEPDPIEPEAADTVSRGKTDQVPAYSGEVSSSAKPEATQPSPIMAELQPQVPGQTEIETVVKAESTASESTIKPETAGSGPEVQKDQPSTEPQGPIKPESAETGSTIKAPIQSGEVAPSAKPVDTQPALVAVETKPQVSGQAEVETAAKAETKVSEQTIRAETVESAPAVQKAQPSTEPQGTTIKPDVAETASPGNAPAQSGEAFPSAKPVDTQPTPVAVGTQLQASGQAEIETVVKAESTASDPTIKPETAGSAPAVQKDQLSVGDVPPKADGFKSEPLILRDQPSMAEVTAETKPIEPDTVVPKTQSQFLETPTASIKPEVGSSVKADQPFAPSGEVALSAKPGGTQPVSVMAEPAQIAHAATAVAQETVPQMIKIVTPRTVQSRGYSVSSESTSLSEVGEGKANSLLEPKTKEAPMFLSSWTPEKMEEKFQPVAEISENKPEDSFQRAVDQGLENLVVQTDTRQSVQLKSEPLPTQTVYLPQKGPDALPHGLVQVVRHVMADGTQKATVIIDPPALGRVEVEVRATSTGIEASFKVDSAQVRDMIKPQIPVLQDMLSQQGIVASSISVDIRQGDERRSPWRDSLDSIKLRRRRGATEEEELETPLMDTARLDMERGVLQWYA